MRLRHLCLVLPLAFELAFSARADTLTYNVTFTAVTGPATGGSGTFTTDSVTGGLLSVNFLVDGQQFTVADKAGVLAANADGSGLKYTGFNPSGYILETNGSSYDLGLYYSGQVGTGTFSVVNPAALPATVTPEPSSFVLLGTGALGVAGAMRRRRV